MNKPLPQTLNTLSPEAQAAIAIASAIQSYGFAAGQAYCRKQGVTAPAGLVRLARQLAACKRHGLGMEYDSWIG